MKLTLRNYKAPDDYWRIRQFLREVFVLNDRRELSWHVVRFDYWRWHGVENLEHFPLEEVVSLWEADSGRIAAVLNPEGKGEAFLQVHPGFRTPELEEEMLDVAEERLSVPGPNGRKKLCVWASANDEVRQNTLARRGYVKGDGPEHQRRRPLDERSLDEPIVEAQTPPGYAVRPMGDGAELLERCYTSGLAFHPDDIRIAVENRADASCIATFRTRRFTAVTSISSPSRPMARWPPFAPSGSTT